MKRRSLLLIPVAIFGLLQSHYLLYAVLLNNTSLIMSNGYHMDMTEPLGLLTHLPCILAGIFTILFGSFNLLRTHQKITFTQISLIQLLSFTISFWSSQFLTNMLNSHSLVHFGIGFISQLPTLFVLYIILNLIFKPIFDNLLVLVSTITLPQINKIKFATLFSPTLTSQINPSHPYRGPPTPSLVR